MCVKETERVREADIELEPEEYRLKGRKKFRQLILSWVAATVDVCLVLSF